MGSVVLQYSRVLAQRPLSEPVAGIALRTYAGPEDIAVWLELRHQAFARQRLGVRHWNRQDFASEFLEKPWWRAEHLWFAETSGALGSPPQAVGTVALAFRGQGPSARPAVHWLAVLPPWRRRGVGRLLMTALEQACWDAGYRQVWLETHPSWTAAVGFYETLGYRRAHE
jgi:GNAT superfamily N-acetyltransferase